MIPWATTRMMHVLVFQWVACSYEITGQCLRGMGHSLMPAIISVMGSCVFRIFWIYTIFQSFNSYVALMNVYPISWILTGIATLIAYAIVRKREYKNLNADAPAA